MDNTGTGRLPGPVPDSDSPEAPTEGSQPPLRTRRRRQWVEPAKSTLRAGRRSSSGDFLCPSLFKPSETVRLRPDDREEPRRRHHQVLSDSENEEPLSRRIRTISAFIRKTTTALTGVGGRSRSCTDPIEERGKLKVLLQRPLIDTVGALTAGVLLSSENSRSVSVPILPPQRRLAWSAVVPVNQSERTAVPLNQSERSTVLHSQSERVPAALAPPGLSERSVSPDSNDSISEELNHFKPIVTPPCTPPKRLRDGRVLTPRVVKATPRNLRELSTLQGSCYQTSAAVLQKWRQIELDRQTVSMTTGGGVCTVSVATHTSPAQDSNSNNTRRLLFEPEESVRIKVPAIHPQDHRDGLRFGSSSKRKLKPKHLEAKRSRSNANLDASSDAHSDDNSDAIASPYAKASTLATSSVSAQERSDRALALQLQRRFDRENRLIDSSYFLRSANQRAERGRDLHSSWTNQSAERGRGLRSSGRSQKNARGSSE